MTLSDLFIINKVIKAPGINSTSTTATVTCWERRVGKNQL